MARLVKPVRTESQLSAKTAVESRWRYGAEASLSAPLFFLSPSLTRKAIAMMNKLCAWFGIAALIFFPARMVWTYGGTWEFSPHGIPVSALSADGKTCRNGGEIDPITEGLIRRGIEEQVSGFAYGGMLLAFGLLAYAVWQYKQLLDSRARRMAAEAVREMGEQWEREGKRPDGAKRPSITTGNCSKPKSLFGVASDHGSVSWTKPWSGRAERSD